MVRRGSPAWGLSLILIDWSWVSKPCDEQNCMQKSKSYFSREIGCRGIRNVALVPDDHVALEWREGQPPCCCTNYSWHLKGLCL